MTADLGGDSDSGGDQIDIDALLAQDPLVLFGAVPPPPPVSDLPLPQGQVDFDDLFDPDLDPARGWAEAAERVDIYKLHAWQVRHYLSDDQLRAIFGWLDEHDIPLMFETEPLQPPDPAECDHTESFEGPYDLEMARRIRDLGGTISVVAIEEPYAFGHKLDGPGACQYTVERIVGEVIDYVTEMRTIFPDVPVGTIEPVWTTPATTPEDMEIWLDTYHELSGEPFAFLHMDIQWTRTDWPQTTLAIEAVADERGVPFGILYNGGTETTSEAWLQFLMERVVEYEITTGGTPQHIAIQSWVDQPDHALPENDPSAFTSVINRYFGTRTLLEASTANAEAGEPDNNPVSLEVALTDVAGQPLADAPITVSVTPLSGALGDHAVSGTVPDTATTAVIAIRVNAEDATPGDADVRLADVAYEEAADGTNRIGNPSFDSGMDGWGTYGDGRPLGDARVEGDGSGTSWLALTATADEHLYIDSAPFDMTPGATYEYRARLGVPERSIGTAAVAIVFLGETEVSRQTILFEPAPAELVTARTDATGTLTTPLDLESGRYTVEAAYRGDLAHWPAQVSTTIEIP